MFNYSSIVFALFLSVYTHASDLLQNIPSLTPEQTRALQYFHNVVTQSMSKEGNISLNFSMLPSSEDELKTFSTGKFIARMVRTKDLLKGDSWLWNQSRAKKTVTNSIGWNITFKKLNQRTKGKNRICFSVYKIWLFNIEPSNGDVFSFLWLEKNKSEQNTADKENVLDSMMSDFVDCSFVYDNKNDDLFADILGSLLGE